MVAGIGCEPVERWLAGEQARGDAGTGDAGVYAVMDVETTGLSPKNDRIIELAIIGLDPAGRQEWEWCSLVNPERDTGGGLAVKVHQIYSRDVAQAPTFADVAGHIVRMLAGRAMIAHNARFDLHMLTAEFGRLGQHVPELVQICTGDMARESGFRSHRLEACCEALGIEMEGAHHALADARATAKLAQQLVNFGDAVLRNDVASRLAATRSWPDIPVTTCVPVVRPIPPVRRRTRAPGPAMADNQREAVDRVPGGQAIPVVESASLDWEPPELQYLAAVEWVLEDREISREQQQALDELRLELNLDGEQVKDVQIMFIRGLAGSMWGDGSLSDHERFDLDMVGRALQLSSQDVAYALANPVRLDLVNHDYMLQPGASVVFTGEMSLPRAEWIERAKRAGLRVAGSVSGKTDYLIVPFGETGSRKTRRARELGVRVISEQRFRRMVERLERRIADPA